MSDLYTQLPKLLQTVTTAGDYYTTNAAELIVPHLTVDGVGPLAFPLLPAMIQELRAVSAPAPYGRGADTLIDPNVRRCGQIDAANIHADDPRWSRWVGQIVASAAAGLGVELPVQATLYKMLVYEQGDFFVSHRDTEKLDHMFGTLVISLPSPSEGGELVVRHDGREVVLDLSSDDVGLARWAAFYADCQHEVRPIRGGCRLVLIYTLTRSGSRRPRVPDQRPLVSSVTRLLAAHPDTPMVVYPLKHAYTAADLAFARLKNEDAARAAVLEAAVIEAGWVLRLGMLSIEESGSASPRWSGRGHTTEGYTVDEVHDRVQTIEAWRTPLDVLEPLGPTPFEDDQLAPPGALDDEVPDHERFQEDSGNEGGTFERSYRRAALVLFPADAALEVITSGTPADQVKVLRAMLSRSDPQAQALAIKIVQQWPASTLDPDADEARTELLEVLLTLEAAGDGSALSRFMHLHVARGGYSEADLPAMIQALSRISRPVEVLVGLVGQAPATQFGAVAALVRSMVELRPAEFAPVLPALVRAVPEAPRPAWDLEAGWRDRSRGLTQLLLAAKQAGDLTIEAAIAERVTTLRWPMDTVVIPALLAAPGSAPNLRALARAHLQSRLQVPLSPPQGAQRSTAGLTCTCGDCAALKAFLRSVSETEWVLWAAEARRAHVTSMVASARSDVVLTTLQQGRPHGLQITKTTASFDALVAQRAQDERWMREL